MYKLLMTLFIYWVWNWPDHNILRKFYHNGKIANIKFNNDVGLDPLYLLRGPPCELQ